MHLPLSHKTPERQGETGLRRSLGKVTRAMFSHVSCIWSINEWLSEEPGTRHRLWGCPVPVGGARLFRG